MGGPETGKSRKMGQPTPAFAVVVLTVVIASAVLVITTFHANPAATPTPTAAPQQVQPAVEVTAAPPLGLSADSYSCGGTAYVPGSTASVVPSGAATAAAAGASSSVSGPGDPAAALAVFVGRLPSILPASGWAPAGGPAGHIVYVAASEKTPAPFAFVDLAIVGNQWVASAYGDCEPAVAAVAASKLSPVYWKVATLDKASTTLNVLFQSNLCGEAFVGMTIWYSQTNVTVTLWARKLDAPDAAASCSATASIQTSPFTLTLAEPLGTRQLQAGPASAAKPADGAPTAAAK
jgi:hypothetical protein